MITSIILGIFFLLPLALCLTALLAWRFWYKNRKRRSPLTTIFLRQPAQYLRERMDDINWDIAFTFMLTGMIPFH